MYCSEEFNIKVEEHKNNLIENINKAKDMNVNKVIAILAIEEEIIQKEILNWLLVEGYKVSLKKDEFNILTLEW